MEYIINLNNVTLKDINRVGGKNASTGEMIQHLSKQGVNVPGGFATTVAAFRDFLHQNNLTTKITDLLENLDVNNVSALHRTSKTIRQWILKTAFSSEFERAVAQAYNELKLSHVSVRSSAISEDLPNASFAGQQESYLNIVGIKAVLRTIKLVYASLYTSRAIAYRQHQGFDDETLGISVGVQPMIRSDKSVSGVMFTLDTESGFDKVILISASYGLGEGIVQGSVNPDEFYVYKPTLNQFYSAILRKQLGDKQTKMVYNTSKTSTIKAVKVVPVPQADRIRYCITDEDVHALARSALLIEQHYKKPMDIEWAKDGITGELFILQARPETVRSQQKDSQTIERYQLQKQGTVLVSGQSIGQQIRDGKTSLILDPKKMNGLKPGDILVTDMTDPDWEPVMKRAGAIITNRGGRTCHAAIIARELGIPAIVGCGEATSRLKNNQHVTVSCAEGHTGHVYAGKLPYSCEKTPVTGFPKLPVKLCLNLASPEMAFATQFLPNEGVGLARLEFIISNMIGIHPQATLQFKALPKALQLKIKRKTAAYANPVEYYIERMREGISTIAAAFNPKPVIFRFSDFKSNEYANLIGGELYEPHEENPMIGFRGAGRYTDPNFQTCFELECKAVKRVREEMGLVNAQVMIPFVRTVEELEKTITVLENYGLRRGDKGLQVYMMCEIPSNALLAEEFLQYVDGFSIGSNDLTQLTLGLDRDSSLVAASFDERNMAVKTLLHMAIEACNRQGKYIGICGQGPSDHPDFAEWLMEEGIQAISLNPDTVVETWLRLGKVKTKKREQV